MVFCNEIKYGYGIIQRCHNPYFSRWFSAIKYNNSDRMTTNSHNPYFSRWFSAIGIMMEKRKIATMSQSLF